MDLARDEDLLLGVVEVVADEDRRVLLAQVAAGQRLQREEEREADLAALRDPAEPGAVLQEVQLVLLERDGLVVVREQALGEAPLGADPVRELLLGALHDPKRHAALRAQVARDLAFVADGSLYGLVHRAEAPKGEPT